MALNEQDERLLSLLASDPDARRELVRHGARLMPDHPVVKQEAATSSSFEERVKPLQAEIEELKKELTAKTGRDMWEARRDEVRRAPFFLNDEQILELEDRMRKDGNQYKSYPEALKYYQYMDQPTHPHSAPGGITPFGRKTKEEQNWRSMIKDPKSRLWKDRKNFMREQWEEGSRDLSNRR
jgi:hypothetical protein